MKKLIVAAMLFASPAYADSIFFGSLLNGSDGKPQIECIRLTPDRAKCEEEITLTLGWLSRLALDMPEDKAPLVEIYKRGRLSEKILAYDKLDLSVDEAKLLKDQIVKLSYRTNIKYQALKLIDPKGAE